MFDTLKKRRDEARPKGPTMTAHVEVTPRADLRAYPDGPVIFSPGEIVTIVRSTGVRDCLAEVEHPDGRKGMWARSCFVDPKDPRPLPDGEVEPFEPLSFDDVRRARELLDDADSEDNERFASWYGRSLLAINEAYRAALANRGAASEAVASDGRLLEIVTDAEIARVHGHANFGTMTAREVVNDGVRKYAVGYHSGYTQLSILLEHGLITKPRPGSHDANLTKKGKAYARALGPLYAAPPSPAPSDAEAKPEYSGGREWPLLAVDLAREEGFESVEMLADKARIGVALMEVLPEGYDYSDCPSEIVCDLINERDDALAAPSVIQDSRTTETVGRDREVSYELMQDDQMVAGSTDWNNLLHYATVYGQDGPVHAVKVVRTPIALAQPAQQNAEAGE